ncbi:MAG: 3-phosphoshikimate 1-carboxyvinyltransferase [Candidatus Eremiobacterota bacterium]
MIEIIPVENIDSSVEIPGSKSYSARALLIAALAGGKTLLKHVLICDDSRYMAHGLREFGINIIEEGNSFTVYGTDGILQVPHKEIFLGNSGTATRFLTGFSSLCPGRSVLTGNSRMKERPIIELLNGLKQLNVNSYSLTGCPPVEIYGGTLKGGTCEMKGSISSQYFSSIMMIAPFARSDTVIKVSGELTSKSYIDITIDIMKSFGVNVDNDNYREFFIKSGQRYTSREYTVESDASSASYFFAVAAITGGTIVVKNINPCSLQGDMKFVDLLETMGCSVIRKDREISITGRPLRGIDIDMNKMPDTVQTLAVVACFAEGETVIKNVSNLRIKETDRLKALAAELAKTGISVSETEDGLVIKGGHHKGAEIDTFDDHRMAMSFALMGLRVPGIKIKNPLCVSKSFPEFWEKLKNIGVLLHDA